MAKRQSKVKEAVIEQRLRERAIVLGGMCIKVRAIGVRGFFDRLIVVPGPRVIFAEVKRPRGGVISPHQAQYHRELNGLGVAVAIVRTIEDIDLLLPLP